MLLNWFGLLLCGWLAATVSGAAGFGGAMLLLPVLTFAVRERSIVPILTVAQLLGNLSRAGFGWREIRWRPALVFSMGAAPASVLGARLFVGLPSLVLFRLIGVCLLIVVALRHTQLGKRKLPEWCLAPAGVGVGFLSGVAGSAGPLGAAAFLGLRLTPGAYVASEAVTAVLMHLAKSITYGRYAALSAGDIVRGLALGGSMMLGSWTGRKLIHGMPEQRFALMVEALLVVSGVVLIARSAG